MVPDGIRWTQSSAFPVYLLQSALIRRPNGPGEPQKQIEMVFVGLSLKIVSIYHPASGAGLCLRSAMAGQLLGLKPASLLLLGSCLPSVLHL